MSKVKYVPRQVIDGKLSAVLNDQAKVAIVVGEDELRAIISGLSGLRPRTKLIRELIKGCQDLLGVFL
jgi:hypothetical protein